MEDKELKKRLKKIPDVDKNGEPIYKIDAPKNDSSGKARSKNEAPAGKNKSKSIFDLL